ncbi:MAG: citrate (Pro-3S)-lyase beta subunit [Frankiales bacterium]|nr:citrate (Pro-3S)-lyase beta subunit [Frankiales bacterium]
MPVRSRRSCLAVPGSNPRMIEKSRGLDVDYVFLDLEDAVAPLAKVQARSAVAEAVAAGGWNAATVAVRVNDLSAPHTYRDVIEVVETAGAHLDVIVLPKVQWPEQVAWLDLLLAQIERTMGFPEGGIAIEAMVESALGLSQALPIAQASPRLEALVFGPGDYAADTGMRSPFVGAVPFEGAFDFALHTIRVAATAAGVQAVDGPWQQVRDLEGLRAKAVRSAGLGFDGTWVLHPDQVPVANEVFTPSQEAYDHAELVLDALDWHGSAEGGHRGAVMLGEEMIDEASRKLALPVAVKGRAAGLNRTSAFTP